MGDYLFELYPIKKRTAAVDLPYDLLFTLVMDSPAGIFEGGY